MEPQWYGKELPTNKLYLSNGHPITFDIMETSDAWLIQELDSAIRNQVGGVIRLTKEQYDEAVKKKSAEKSPVSSPSYRQEIMPTHQFTSQHQQRVFPQGGRVAVAAGSNQRPAELPDPLTVPDPSTFTMPKVAKVNFKKP